MICEVVIVSNSRSARSAARCLDGRRATVVVIPGGTEHEAWFREDTQVIDFFAAPRDDFLLGGKPAYMSED
jgi:hypothetical protein